ncbi:hypothetical protein TREES_T100004011 [Tupaia chinensis]|uniref:Uncharacterized protein n=1 Tax=Tupaia chinensis TaxID=246437 RepID=L9KMZ8_TUPCH|nr:hypothetical protein TREES_T100004011 [Tupaia chinensis]
MWNLPDDRPSDVQGDQSWQTPSSREEHELVRAFQRSPKRPCGEQAGEGRIAPTNSLSAVFRGMLQLCTVLPVTSVVIRGILNWNRLLLRLEVKAGPTTVGSCRKESEDVLRTSRALNTLKVSYNGNPEQLCVDPHEREDQPETFPGNALRWLGLRFSIFPELQAMFFLRDIPSPGTLPITVVALRWNILLCSSGTELVTKRTACPIVICILDTIEVFNQYLLN